MKARNWLCVLNERTRHCCFRFVARSVSTTQELSSESKIYQNTVPSHFFISNNHTSDKPMAMMLPLWKAGILNRALKGKFPGSQRSSSRGYWFGLLGALAIGFLLPPQLPRSGNSSPPVSPSGTLTWFTFRTILEGRAVVVFTLGVMKPRFRNVQENVRGRIMYPEIQG